MTGSRSALGFDPAPGDTSQGQDMATTLRNVTNALEQIKNVVSGTGDQHWEGKTAESFRGLMSEDLKPRIEDAWQSFDTASKALDSWVLDLGSFQSRADALEIEAEHARQDISAAETTLNGMGDKPDDPAKAATFADKQTANQDALSGKQAVLDDIIARAHTLAGEATDSATTAAGALQTAMDAAPDEPGLWDRITGLSRTSASSSATASSTSRTTGGTSSTSSCTSAPTCSRSPRSSSRRSLRSRSASRSPTP